MAAFPPNNPVETEEDCSSEEAESVLGDKESEEGTENPQEEVNFELYDDQEPNVIDSRPLASGLSSAINAGLGNSSSPDTQNQTPMSDQTMNRGSTSFARGQNRNLASPNRSDSRTSLVIGLGSRSSSSLVTQNQIPTNARSNNSATRMFASVDLNFAPRRPPFSPYPPHPMAMMRMPIQNIVPRPPFFVDQNYLNQPFGMWHVPILVPGQANQMIPILGPGQVPMWPMMYSQQQGQMVPNILPVQAPMRPTRMHNQQMVPNLVPGQAQIWPWMYNQELYQMVPNLVPGQASIWPVTYNQQQVPNVVRGQAPVSARMHNQQQNHMVPGVVRCQAPVRPMLNNQQEVQIVIPK